MNEHARRLWNSLSRMWRSTRVMFSFVVARITRNTGTAVKVTGHLIGGALATIVMLFLIALIAGAAIPYGAFAATQKETQANADTIVDSVPFCYKCGQVKDKPEQKFIYDEKGAICPDCQLT